MAWVTWPYTHSLSHSHSEVPALFMMSLFVGAASDIEHATKIARAMVTRFGMTEAVSPILLPPPPLPLPPLSLTPSLTCSLSQIGPVAHGGRDDATSPATQKLIDDEIKTILKVSTNIINIQGVLVNNRNT